MNSTLARTCRFVLVAINLTGSVHAFAGQELIDLDASFRARIAKEKVRSAALQRKMEAQEKALGLSGKSLDESNCGSQNIGNVDTGERGAANAPPRDVFVFAPNAINIVGQGGCR
ncbi:hypothetical protein GCM10027034_30910 [Ramlibacter solisilvae]|uniref:Uncharacterized protein n=1 Tax=Ramlibacter tataouinensis TaxID=94132 RepID=A0A127JRQ1_9BURK|nr:hypothetical protein [Ramlibacter tataouinensis]AMO22650.1 hypothetical protein UC35_06830 [Ramlibacter tataouinensis]